MYTHIFLKVPGHISKTILVLLENPKLSCMGRRHVFYPYLIIQCSVQVLLDPGIQVTGPRIYNNRYLRLKQRTLPGSYLQTQALSHVGEGA